MNVYTDESGDLGWTLDKPYRNGGSSKYLTIAHAIVPKSKKHIPKRIVRNLYDFMSWPTGQELKAAHLKPKHRVKLATDTAAMLASNPDIKVVAITVKKENVIPRIRRDQNKLYNYMMRLSLLDHIQHVPRVSVMTDRRSVKVASGNSMVDYLQMTLVFDMESDTVLEDHPLDSQQSLNIQFADFMANFVWRCHEVGDHGHMAPLDRYIVRKTLFFR